MSHYAVLPVSCGLHTCLVACPLLIKAWTLTILTTVFHGFTHSVQSCTMPDVIRPRPLPDVFHHLSHSLSDSVVK
jgi:hypothetical protein